MDCRDRWLVFHGDRSRDLVGSLGELFRWEIGREDPLQIRPRAAPTANETRNLLTLEKIMEID